MEILGGRESVSFAQKRQTRRNGKQHANGQRVRYVPGFRNLFLFITFVLLPAIILFAWFDATVNQLEFSWLFGVAFVGMFGYGLLVELDLGFSGGAAYLAVGFIIVLIVAKVAGTGSDMGQLIWGTTLGWFSGVAADYCYRWLKLRGKWNEEHPYARC